MKKVLVNNRDGDIWTIITWYNLILLNCSISLPIMLDFNLNIICFRNYQERGMPFFAVPSLQ